jgi:hypothetical protein
VDFVITRPEGNVGVLIDEGPAGGADTARHLRFMHAHGHLLVGLPSGGVGATTGPVVQSERVPAWRIKAAERVPELTC